MIRSPRHFCMELLHLSPQAPPKQLLASQFPEPADVYICDKCGRDITAHLHRRRAHVRPPLGPARYVCRCGARYLSGANEWDNLSDWDRRQWLSDVGLAVIILVALMSFSILLYRAFLHRSTMLVGCLVVVSLFSIPLFPLFAAILAIPFEIAASIWRTRVVTKPESK